MKSTLKKAARVVAPRTGAGDRDCPAEKMDSEAPLFILYDERFHRQTQGILHTTGGYLLGAKLTCSTSSICATPTSSGAPADVGWVTGHR